MRHSTHLTKCKLAKAIIPEIPTQSWRQERGGVQKKGTRSHKITERACESGMWVSETGCCQMGLPREVQLRFDHRDEGGHSKQGGTAASSQVLSLPELFLRSVPLNLQGYAETFSHPDFPGSKTVGNSSNNWQALLESTEGSLRRAAGTGRNSIHHSDLSVSNPQGVWKDRNSYPTSLTLAHQASLPAQNL